MANITKKNLMKRIRQLADRKTEISQPGRLLAHIINELNLSSESSVRGTVKAALDTLEEQGLITIGRSGNVYNSMTRTSRQRAKSTGATERPVVQHPINEENRMPIAQEPTVASLPVKNSGSSLSSIEMIQQITTRCEQSDAQALEFKERAELAEAQAETLRGQVEGLRAELQTKAQATQSLVDCKRRIEGQNSQLKKNIQGLRDQLGHSEARSEKLTAELTGMNEAAEIGSNALIRSQEQNATLTQQLGQLHTRTGLSRLRLTRRT